MKSGYFFIVFFFHVVQVHGFIGNNIFDTGNPILFDVFCVDNSASLHTVGRKSSTLQAITIDGLKRSIIELFTEINPDYIEPTDLASTSLSELFQ